MTIYLNVGDCGPRFSDPAQPDRVLEIEGPGRGSIAVHNRNITSFHVAPFPAGFIQDPLPKPVPPLVRTATDLLY